MIYFLYGNNTEMVNEKANRLVADLLKKKPDASFFTLDDENWSPDLVEEYLSSQGLFENKYIVLIKNIFSANSGVTGPAGTSARKVRKEEFLDKIKDLADSANIFIVAEGAVDAASLKKIEKHASKVQEYGSGKENSASGRAAAASKKTSEFKLFDMADAFGSRDKRALWALYRQAIEAGKVPEEIHGILFWQAKSMVIASRTKTAAEAGLNPFVFGKAQRYAVGFSDKELSGILERMVAIYHDAHRGIHDFETALEIFILEY